MKSLLPPISRMLALVIPGVLSLNSLAAQTINQSITLQPGWNAVWLEVEPEINQTDEVFEGMPVSSVWTRLERTTTAEFIQSVSEAAFTKEGWQRWFPPSREESVLNNLFTVQANRAYLIKLSGSVPVIWNLNGRPSLRRPEWVPDSFTLRGAPVDPAVPVTFLNFFRASKAHYKATGNTLQPIYRLNNAQGAWVPVNGSEVMKSGEAYWIFSEGASDYLAPLDAKVESGDGLDFGSELTALNLSLENHKTAPVNAMVESGTGGQALSYAAFDPQLGKQWPELPTSLAVPLESGAKIQVRLAPRRKDQAEATKQSVIKIRDGAGVRLLIPTSVERTMLSSSGGSLMAGLWVGNATIKAVSEAHSTNDSVTPTPTKSEFSLRVIIHVDAAGEPRLLKEVIQMWKDGTYTIDGNGDTVVATPGEYVLLTDDALIPQFKGAAVRDGQSVGRRVSTIGYDFTTANEDKSLDLSGSFGIGQPLTATLGVPGNHPTNPYLHKYHPDHDNLNAQFNGPAAESFQTTRQISFSFAATPPDGPAVPDFGYDEMGGNYQEVISGLHKNAIHLGGTFRLSRVSPIAEINPSP
ncbi:MAG: hypothetical protein V4819_18280 [Verrucomicrobiota bacterium]